MKTLTAKRKSKYTEGPWKLHVIHYTKPGNDGALKITAKINGVNTRIAEVYPWDWHESEANANLIATAPELLEASKDILASIKEMGYAKDFPIAIQQLESAIAKAEGK